jgi:hypothetical protein
VKVKCCIINLFKATFEFDSNQHPNNCALGLTGSRRLFFVDCQEAPGGWFLISSFTEYFQQTFWGKHHEHNATPPQE